MQERIHGCSPTSFERAPFDAGAGFDAGAPTRVDAGPGFDAGSPLRDAGPGFDAGGLRQLERGALFG